MIETGLMPRRIPWPVTELANEREARRAVNGLARSLVIGRVTRCAIAQSAAEIAVVTLIASERPMGAAQRECRLHRVVPGHRGPGAWTMALFALIAESRAVNVVLPANPMTVVAAGRCALDDTPDMAVAAGCDQVPPLERKQTRLVKGA
jgi:hypothetical protein